MLPYPEQTLISPLQPRALTDSFTYLPPQAHLKMCKYWKKLHTCDHPSDRPYIEMCRPGLLSNTVCPDISDDPILRASHFPCWTCIKTFGRVDAEEKHERCFLLASAAESARSHAIKTKLEAEKRTREERVRREAREKAERERTAEQKARFEHEKEAERERKEGGGWKLAEVGSGKKKRKGSVPGSPASPTTPTTPSAAMGGASNGVLKENGNSGHAKAALRNERSEISGRAGVWGPKKILSRNEGAGVFNRVDSATDTNGKN